MSNIDELSILTLFGKTRRLLNLKAVQAMRPFGIGPKQAILLRELRTLKTSCLSDLARATLTDPAATGKIIDSLIKKNWIQRVDDPQDRRRWQVLLTDEGIEATLKLENIFKALAKEICIPLSTSQKNEFFKI